MKVYVVTSGEYSDYHIDAVCIDKATAETIAYAIEENGYDEAYVEEYDTDDFSAKPAKMWSFGCMIDKKKPVFLNPDTLLRCYGDETTFDRSKRITPMELADKAESEEGNMVYFCVFTAPEDSVEKAEKIAQDLVTQANYILIERGKM